jgi:hypothetical protein
MKGEAFLAIYRDRRSGDFLIEEKVEDPGFRGTFVVWGERTPVSQAEMQAQGLALIRKCLEEFRVRRPGSDFVPSKEPPAFRRKLRSLDAVSVTQLVDGSIRLVPLHHREGGFVGRPQEERLLLAPDVGQEEFFARLMEAFEQCT